MIKAELKRCISIERRWNKNEVSRGSPDKEVNRRPTSLKKFRADALRGPRVSIATGLIYLIGCKLTEKRSLNTRRDDVENTAGKDRRGEKSNAKSAWLYVDVGLLSSFGLSRVLLASVRALGAGTRQTERQRTGCKAQWDHVEREV